MSKSVLLTPVLLASITAIAALAPVSSAYAGCSDCSWLYVRCMSHANTSEKAQECEDARQLCEETFCTNPLAARWSASPSRVENPLPQARDSENDRPQARRSAQ